MSEFAGIIRFDGAAVDPADVERIRQNLHGVGRPWIWQPTPSVVLAERRGPRAFDNGSAAAPTQAPGERYLLASVKLDSPGDVAAALGVSVTEDRSLFATACSAWGIADAAMRLHGEFAAAEWDNARKRLTIARCAFGARSVFYVRRPWGIVFGTALQNILPIPDVPRDLDEVMLAHTATLGFQDWESTIYRHIRRAPVGGFAVFEPDSFTTKQYYTLESIKQVRFSKTADYIDAARDLLDKAVLRRMPADGVLATQLSGGFDSTGVTATLARLAGERPVHAFTRVPGLEHPYDMDERALAAHLVERYPNIRWTIVDDVHEHYRDVEPDFEAGATCVPRRSSFNTTWFEPLRSAILASGAEAVFNGGAGNSTLTYHGAPDFAGHFQSGHWLQLARDLHGRSCELGLPMSKVAASAAFNGYAPRALKRWHAHRKAGRYPWLNYSLVSRQFLDDVDYHRLTEFLGHDIPFQPLYSRRELRLRMLQAQGGRDLTGALQRAGPPLLQCRPMADRALVEFALGIPEDLYWRNGQSRWLGRQVLADRVPREILTSKKRGKQSPEWYALATRRHKEMEEAVERIGRSKLARRVLDIPRMQELLATWPKDAKSAIPMETLYGHGLQRAIALGGFLRWHEGSNE